MDRDMMFLCLVAAVSFLFAAFQILCFILKRRKTAQTVGTVISVKLVNPESAKARNSKWARVSYKVNGRSFTSQKRVQVPMTAQIGSPVTVRYDVESPEKLYSFSVIKIFVAFLVTVLCILVIVFR